MLDSTLNKTIGREFESLDKSKNRQIMLTSIIILLVLTSFYFLKPTVTGLIVIEKQFDYSDSINLEFNESSEYIWVPEQQGLLKSIEISGSYKTEGNVKVYLEDEGIKYLIFSSEKLNGNGLASITGLVVLNESEENNESIINQTNKVKNNEIIINESIEKIINKKITAILEYKKDTIYDVDNNGIEDIYGVVDLTVENTLFNWEPDESKLCTRWNLESIEKESSTVICNGNQNCCAFVDLFPSSNNWNDTIYLTYGLYDSTFNNKVSSQVIHVDYNLSADVPYSEIFYSGWKELPLKFFKQFSSFGDICEETCAIYLNKTSYKLIIELENSILKLDTINYNVEDDKKGDNTSIESYEQLSKSRVVINKPVKWLKKIKIGQVKGQISVNITSDATNITINKVEQNNLFKIPETKIKINDKGKIKDLKEYEIDKEIEKEKKKKDKETDLEKIQEFEGKIIELESDKEELINLITGNVISEDIVSIDNTISTQVIIDDLVEEIEIEYFTEGPISEELEINDFKKRITISSDIHYEDILAFTFLSREVNSGSAKLYWILDNTRINVDIVEYDTNDNNLIDYIEWNVPSLSSQIYELIIEISKAEHLDSNKVFIEDVFDLVGTRDNRWTGPIPINHYIRVTFEQRLTNDKDITIYARSDQDAVIEVYEKDQDNPVGTFDTINEDKKYKLLLTNLIGSQDVFDLKIINYPVEFDYIVDPDTTLPTINGTINKSLNNILEGDTLNVTFNATDNINLTNASIIINDTGFNRYFNFSLNGSSLITLEFSQNFTVNCSSGCVINITGIARDNSSNEAQNETIITVQDVTAPTPFDLLTPPDDTKSTDFSPSLDWENTTEPNFKNYTVEFSTSSSFSFINHSFKAEGNITNSSFTLTTTLTPNLNWTWRVIAYDKSGNKRISTSAFRYETFENSLPTVPSNTLPSNNTIKFHDNINFTWTQSIDADNDDISYDLLIAKDTEFTDIDLNITGINANYLDLIDNRSILSGDKRYWKVRSYDNANYSDYSGYFDLTVIVAKLNISAPAINNSKFYSGNKTEINVLTVNGTDWIQNVTVEFNGTNYTASNTGDTWAVNISFSSLRSNFINITAYGFNRTDNLTTITQRQIIFSKVDSQPTIDYICSNETYALNNTNVTVKLKASLDALVKHSNATLTNPSNIVIPLNFTLTKEELSGATEILYRYEDTYFVNETGDYIINATIVDVEGSGFNTSSTFQVITKVRNINVSSINVDSININDVCTNDPITNGTTIIRTIPDIALYNVEVRTSKPTVVFNNINLSNTTFLLNYTDLERNISAPSGQRIVTEFEINSNLSTFDNINISYNYSGVEGNLDDETGLRMYKCASKSSCTFERLITTLDTTTNIISTTSNDLSVFLVSETAITIEKETVTETTTVTAGGAAGGGVGGGSIVAKVASLDLIVQSLMSLHTQDSVIVPIILKNSGELKLNGLNLSYDLKADGITLEFEDIYFESLGINESVSTNVRITTDVEEFGKNVISITVNVIDPKLTESVDIIIDVIDIFKDNRTLGEEKIKFAQDLFDKNFECLKLKDLLTEAKIALENKEFQKALRLTESGINTCRQLIDEKIKKPTLRRPSKLFGFRITLPLTIAFLIIILALVIYSIRSLGMPIGFSLKYSIKKKHRFKMIGPTKKEIKTFENEEKEISKMLSR